MYIFAEPYSEAEIDTIQTGEYLQALRLAENHIDSENVKEPRSESEDAVSHDGENVSTTSPSVEAGPSMSSEEEDDLKENNGAEMNSENGDTDIPNVQSSERDLLAMALTVNHFVNNLPVYEPPTPSVLDTWEIAYTFMPFPSERGRRLYKMCQERRRKAFDEEIRERGLDSMKTRSKTFIRRLRYLSNKGMKWREDFEKTFGDREKVVWKPGPPPSNMTPQEPPGKD
jgi:hypothetical protein